MNTSATQATPYSVTRLTFDVPRTFEDFQGHYEQAAPPMPREEVDALVARGAPWSERLVPSPGAPARRQARRAAPRRNPALDRRSAPAGPAPD